MMKILNYYILIFAITITNASFSFAKAGPPIPIPKNPAIEAIKIARQRFHFEFPDNKRFTESEDLKIEDFIVMNAVYTKSYKSYKFENWGWVIVFRHPKHSDNSFVYIVNYKGEASLLYQTE